MRAVKALSALAMLILSGAVAGNGTPQASGSIRGTVEDPTGAPIPGAKVTLAGKGGEDQSAVSGVSTSGGQFEIQNLPGGQYTLEVKAKGFTGYTARVKVMSETPLSLRIRMQVQAVTEEVEVTAAAPDASSTAENLTAVRLGHLLEDLPVKEGDIGSVASLFLDPAATGSEGAQIVVDGDQAGNLDLPLSSVKRVLVDKNPYSAEFNRPGRGRIEVITREGSHRHYHRSASVLFRNAALDARNTFAPAKPESQRAIVEGDIGGPLKGENASFLLSGRYFDFRDSAVISAETPSGRVAENVRTPEQGSRLFGRIDFRPARMHSVWTSYKFKDSSKRNQGVGGFDLPDRALHIDDREHKAEVHVISTLAPNVSNDARFSGKNERQESGSLNGGPAIIVPGAFRQGGAQVSRQDRENSLNFEDIAAIATGRHMLRMGGEARLRFLRVSDADNFGGTFFFSSLDTFQQQRPFLFTINWGKPSLNYAQHEYFYFAQDEIRVRPNLSLSVGFRHEFQSNLDDHDNVAPRIALAYAPGKGNSVVRLGAGVFYDRQPRAIAQRSLLFDGRNIIQAVVSDPAFPLDIAATPLLFRLPSVVRTASDMQSPYLAQASVAIEHKLGRRKNVALEYTRLRGLHLFRSRNVNAPQPGTGLRADPSFLNINQFESSASSYGNSFRFTFQMEAFERLELISQYILSRTIDDTSGLSSLPANNYNLAPERGRADFDRRHQVRVLGTVRLPYRTKLATVISMASGTPFNITTGFDDNSDTVANDRPPGVRRNTGIGPGYANVDLRLSKKMRFSRDGYAPKPEIRLDAFNVWNRVNYQNFIGTLSSPFFGRANAALPARQIQLTLKVEF